MKKVFLLLVFLLLFSFSGCVDEQNETDYEYSIIPIKIDAGNDYVVDAEFILPKTEAKVPAVIIVPGSGPMNMDGKVNSQTPYEDLGIQLGKKGIASIRFNKVTYQYQNEIGKDYAFTIIDEYIPTIESSIEFLKNQAEIKVEEIYLIGHSLGSQIIPLVLAKDASLAGGIIMAGTTMHLLDLLLEQVKKQDEPLYNEYLPYCNYAKGLLEVPKGEEQYFYFGAYSAYYVNYNKLNKELVKELVCPILILQGELDLQVTMDHFNEYKELLKDNENVEFINYEKLNHLFSNGEGENIKNAYLSKKSVSIDVIEDIYKFISN